MNSEKIEKVPSLLVSLGGKKHDPLESISMRSTHLLLLWLQWPTTFRSRPVANVALLLSARESIAGGIPYQG